MAPCTCASPASMRQASTDTSCVAEENATSRANSTMRSNASPGSVAAMTNSPTAMPIRARSIQQRRLPSQRVSNGSGSRSMTGAQKNLMEYSTPSSEAKPITVRDTPACFSHADRVWSTSRYGRPEEKPRKPMPMTRGWPYIVHAVRQRCSRPDGCAAASEGDIIIQRKRRMIGQPLLAVDRFGHGLVGQSRRGRMVVDAPADVVVPGAAPVRPPGVFVGIRVQAAKDVDQPDFIEHAIHPVALMRQKAG